MKLFFIMVTLSTLIPLSASAGILEALNPTKLWELRDSLNVLVLEEAYADDANRILQEVPTLNKHMSRASDIIPFPRLRMDIAQSNCPARAIDLDRISNLLDKHDYQTIATDCNSIRTISAHITEDSKRKLISVTNSALLEFIDSHSGSTNLRILYIVRLCRMVQCELALVTLGLELKEYRKKFSNPNHWVKGLLVVNGYYDEPHLKTMLRLVRAQTNLK